MTYDVLMAIVEKSFKVKIRDIQQVVEELYYKANSQEDSVEYFYCLYDLIELVEKQSSFEGDADEFHNLSVTYAREEDFSHACIVLQKGIEQYPYSVDLLSDYLNYGMQCGKVSECATMLESLMKVKKLWNWRAYRFSIDYLKKLMSIDGEDRLEQIQELVNEFVLEIPDSEESYITKADFLKETRNKGSEEESFLSILEFATSAASLIKRTPKCDLKLADFYYDVGKDLSKANDAIERCKRNSVETQLSVNRTYVYILSALCKMSIFYDSIDKGESKKVQNESLVEQKVLEIFDDYHVAAINRMDARVRSCRELIESFVRETGVPYPYDDGIVNDI